MPDTLVPQSEEMVPEKVTVELSQGALDALQEIAHRYKVDLGEALEIALGNELFILREKADGGKILVRRKDGSRQELVVGG